MPDTRTNDFSTTKLNYAGFMNAACTSSDEIEATGFYIVGSDGKSRPHFRFTAITLP